MSEKIDKVCFKNQEITLIEPSSLKKLKKTELIVVVNKYQEVIEDIQANNNQVVDRFMEAQEAFVALAHAVYGVDSEDKMSALKQMCKKVVDKEAERASQNQNETQTFETIHFEGVDYERCVGGEDNNKVYNDSMDWVGFWDEENKKIIFR